MKRTQTVAEAVFSECKGSESMARLMAFRMCIGAQSHSGKLATKFVFDDGSELVCSKNMYAGVQVEEG